MTEVTSGSASFCGVYLLRFHGCTQRSKWEQPRAFAEVSPRRACDQSLAAHSMLHLINSREPLGSEYLDLTPDEYCENMLLSSETTTAKRKQQAHSLSTTEASTSAFFCIQATPVSGTAKRHTVASTERYWESQVRAR